jgi:hypothetical protein
MSLEQDSIDRGPKAAAMEGSGFYNRHSTMQAAGISLLLGKWEKAISEVELDDGPYVIADYGASQGRNSMTPMRMAIEGLRKRTAHDIPIEVIHTDLPSNDFTALFTTLDDDPTSYLKGTRNVFSSAVGRSYFEPILRPGTVRLGWNTWSLHWMSGAPIAAPDHVLPGLTGSPDVLARLQQRQDADWRRFLECRSEELSAGAKLLSAFTTRDAEGVSGWEWLGGELWQSLCDLGDEGVLSSKELDHTTVPAAGRSVDEIRAPFGDEGVFAGIHLDSVELLKVPDPIWMAFQDDGDLRQYGANHANSVRAWSGPSIAKALEPRADTVLVLDRLFARLAERVAASPDVHEPYLAVVELTRVSRL